MYMLFWGEGRIECWDSCTYSLPWDPGEKTNSWCSWFQRNHSGFWLEKIEKHLFPSFQILYRAKPCISTRSLEHRWGCGEEGVWVWERSECKPCCDVVWESSKRCPSRGCIMCKRGTSRSVSALLGSSSPWPRAGRREQDKESSERGAAWHSVGSRAQPAWIRSIWRGFVPTTEGNSCSSPSKSATISHTNHFLSCLSFLKTSFCLFRSSHVKMQ